MVANLATTTLVRFKKTKGVVTITSMKPLGMGIRCLAAGARGPRRSTSRGSLHTGLLGGWMHQSIRGRPAGGEKCLLTSPFIGRILYCPGLVDATNNLAERVMRILVMIRKNWDGNRTENGARTQAILTSVLLYGPAARPRHILLAG